MAFEPSITVCSDASVSDKHKVAAWACYVRTQGVLVKTGGILKTPISSSNVAERTGIANALWIANEKTDLTQLKLIVYCDNIMAMKMVKVTNKTGRLKRASREHNEFFEKNILPYLEKARSYELRHVKGHLKMTKWDSVSKRNFMNRWCDKHARSLLRAEVERINKEQGVTL